MQELQHDVESESALQPARTRLNAHILVLNQEAGGQAVRPEGRSTIELDQNSQPELADALTLVLLIAEHFNVNADA